MRKTPAAISGVYIVSIRRDADREALRAAAYAHVGLSVDAPTQEGITVAEAFTDAGYTLEDLIGFIEGLHALATGTPNPEDAVHKAFGERGGIDSEGRKTDLFMMGLGGKSENTNWLACAETIQAVWPRLMATFGVEVSGMLFDDDSSEVDRKFNMSRTRAPKILRLKSGWDYDAEGNQVHLPLEEAWRRFVAHNDARTGDGHMDAKMMRKMRRHMKGSYAERAKTRLRSPSTA